MVCYFTIKLKSLFLDDTLDAFAIHGVGGIYGCLFTGIFASKYIPAAAGLTIAGGWLDNNVRNTCVTLC